MEEEILSYDATTEPVCSSEPPAQDPVDTLREENASLQAELSQLREEMAQLQRQQQEMQEFSLLYPETDPATLPKEVTDSSLPLCAAYALYCRKQEQNARLAEAANAQNAQVGSGSVRHDGEGDRDFTVEEIRRMSLSTVRRNYSNILRSLKKHK